MGFTPGRKPIVTILKPRAADSTEPDKVTPPPARAPQVGRIAQPVTSPSPAIQAVITGKPGWAATRDAVFTMELHGGFTVSGGAEKLLLASGGWIPPCSLRLRGEFRVPCRLGKSQAGRDPLSAFGHHLLEARGIEDVFVTAAGLAIHRLRCVPELPSALGRKIYIIIRLSLRRGSVRSNLYPAALS